MEKWEYMTVNMTSEQYDDLPIVIKMLGEMGGKGWELVTTQRRVAKWLQDDVHYRFYFKRKLIEDLQ